MEASHPFAAPPAAPAPQWWRLGRATIGFLLDILSMGRGTGDVIDPLIVSVVIEANVAPINQDPELSVRYATLEAVPPEELRRPVSINAVAASLMLPYETVRRRVARMIETGAIVATPKGVVVPAMMVDNPFYLITATARYERMKRFYFELKALGFLDGVLPLPNDVPAYASPPIRAANRAISEYVLRLIEAVMRHVGDPVSGLIVLELGRANSENLTEFDKQIEGPIPDERRTPVSMLELSRRVGLPAETVRRHVKKLIAGGFVRSGKGGCYAAVERLATPNANGNGLADNLSNLQRMFARCAAQGVIAHWEKEAAGAARPA